MKRIIYLAVCVAMLSGGMAQASIVITDSFSFALTSYTPTIYMKDRGSAFTATGGGPMGTGTLSGGTLPYLFCLNPGKYIYDRNYHFTEVSTTGEIYGATLANANKISFLIWNFGTKVSGDQARGLQAAIWNLVDSRYTLDYNKSNSAVEDAYTSMLRFVTGYTATDLIERFYWITPGEKASDIMGAAYQATVAPVPTPVPGSMLLMCSGFAGLVGLARYRRLRTAS